MCEVAACMGSQRRGICLFWPSLAPLSLVSSSQPGNDWHRPAFRLSSPFFISCLVLVSELPLCNAVGFIYSSVEVTVHASLWTHVEFVSPWVWVGFRITAPQFSILSSKIPFLSFLSHLMPPLSRFISLLWHAFAFCVCSECGYLLCSPYSWGKAWLLWPQPCHTQSLRERRWSSLLRESKWADDG